MKTPLYDEVVSPLRHTLEAGGVSQRITAARALGRLGADDEATISVLLHLYPKDPADAVRHAVLETLLALGQAEQIGMVLVLAGRFVMGSPKDSKKARDNEKSQHEIDLPDFYIDRAPVTNAQYRRFIEADGYRIRDYWTEAGWQTKEKEGWIQPSYWDDPSFNGDKQPVAGVSWYEALAYSRWAGTRLPTEAEWEKAARSTDGRTFPWGDEWEMERGNTKEVGVEKTTPVGQYSPQGDSCYGCVDMAGNVWEWTLSLRKNYPYKTADGREDLASSGRRVVRGGSFYDDQRFARCAYRGALDPHIRRWNSGFRCAAALFSPDAGRKTHPL